MGIIESVATFATDPAKMLVVVVFILLGIAAILMWKRYNKAWLLYVHLFFVLSPLFYFALSINCSLSTARPTRASAASLASFRVSKTSTFLPGISLMRRAVWLTGSL